MAESNDPEVTLFQKLSKMLENIDVRETVPALTGVLVRELASAIAIHKFPDDLAERVLRVVLEDVKAEVANWRGTPKH